MQMFAEREKMSREEAFVLSQTNKILEKVSKSLEIVANHLSEETDEETTSTEDWVSVADGGLPEFGQLVLATVDRGERIVAILLVGKRDGKYQWIDPITELPVHTLWDSNSEVVAWKPLPKPYKEDV